MSCLDVTSSPEREKAERDARFRDEALRWLPEVTRYALSLTRDETDAEDLVQETYLREALAAAALHTSAVQGGYGDLFATVDLTDAVDRALAGLPDEFREAIILVDLGDQSYAAASEVLGVPVGTVRSRLFRGRRLLQEALLAYARDAGLVRGSSDGPPGWDLER